MKYPHPHQAKVSFDGGDLDCGNGLLLLIRKHIDPLEEGELLEINSTEISVKEDLPAWCRLTNNELVSTLVEGKEHSFLVSKGKFNNQHLSEATSSITNQPTENINSKDSDIKTAAQELKNFSCFSIGSWPRPIWLTDILHKKLSNKISEAEFNLAADDAVKLCILEQEQAEVDVITDGEQRRDNYSSFVGGILENCQLIPLTDLLPLVDHPEEFAKELDSLDVPASEIRHPAVFGKISRIKPLAVHEAEFLIQNTNKPIKIALPGPYLLTRTMWMECISDKAYANREELSQDVVRVLREELKELLDIGVSLVQFDEPVLSEVVFTNAHQGRSFMCGALGEKKDPKTELNFAVDLLNQVTKDFDLERIALHICRGNWTKDETKALSGPYDALLPYFEKVQVGTLLLEHATSRAGDYGFLEKLPKRFNLGLGMVDQKKEQLESEAEVLARLNQVLDILGEDYKTGKKNIFLVPDCGFATFADSPICSANLAKDKLHLLSKISDKARSLLTNLIK